MSIRWVICPVVIEGGARKPKVSTIVDPGRPANPQIDGGGNPVLDGNGDPVMIPKHLCHTSVISDGQPGQENGWCLSQVRGVDFSLMDADPEIIDIFEADHPASEHVPFLNGTMRGKGWKLGRLNRLKTKMGGRGVNTDAFGLDISAADILEIIGNRFRPKCNPRAMKTTFLAP